MLRSLIFMPHMSLGDLLTCTIGKPFMPANVVSEKVNGDTAEVEVSHSADATLVFSLKKSGSNWYITGVGGLGEL